MRTIAAQDGLLRLPKWYRMNFGGAPGWNEASKTQVHFLAITLCMDWGEPPKPWMTKFWGVPYRSRALPWPYFKNGYPIPFRAQLNFTDSKDVVGDLPGDLLLVFCHPGDVWAAVFEWGSTSIADTISMEEVRRFSPAIESVFLDFCCYGERFRSFDLYPDDNTFYSSVTCIGGASNFDVPNMRRYNTETRCLEWANRTEYVGATSGDWPALPLFGVDLPLD